MPHSFGTVEAIFIAPQPASAMRAVPDVKAIAGTGLAGDRYGEGTGTFQKAKIADQQLSLIEAEAIEAARENYELDYHASDSRRNIVTRGVALNHLVNREFCIGSVRVRGARLAEPCGHMEKLCGKPGSKKALVHRGGIRAEILTSGTIRVGDSIALNDVELESRRSVGQSRL